MVPSLQATARNWPICGSASERFYLHSEKTVREGPIPSAFQHKAWIERPRSLLLETSSPPARRMARLLSFATVATRLSEGELASNVLETGDGKVLSLKRLSFNFSADIFLKSSQVVTSCEPHCIRNVSSS